MPCILYINYLFNLNISEQYTDHVGTTCGAQYINKYTKKNIKIFPVLSTFLSFKFLIS